MHIEKDFAITFNKEKIIRYQGKSAERMLAHPRMANDFHEILKEIPKLVHPVAIWDSFSVKGIKHDKLILENDLAVGGGPVVQVMAGATEFIICLCTVGDEIDHAISAYQKEGQKQMVKAIFLDSLASYAVGQVREQLINRIRKTYDDRDVHTTIALSPGESQWSISDQKLLFQLLDAKSIGMTVNDSMLMIPMKSLSFTIGAGPNELGMESGSRCQFCMAKEKCDQSELKIK